MPSPVPSANKAARLATLLAICVCSALQFRSLTALSGSGIGGADLDAAWAPDFTDVLQQKAAKQRAKRENAEETKTEKRKAVKEKAEKRKAEKIKARRRAAEQKKRNKQKNLPKKKKKGHTPRRFETKHYNKNFTALPWTLPKPKPVRYQQKSHEFMIDYIAAKRKRHIPLPWEQKEDVYADRLVSLPLPIISLNFPKSATLTMKEFFACGGLTAIHTSTIHGRIALCMMENHFKDRPPLEGCDVHQLRTNDKRVQRSKGVLRKEKYVPIDFISDIGLQGPPCYYSSLHDGGLENIAKYYPNATILLVTRDATRWARSVAKWGSMLHRFKMACGFHGDLNMHPNGTNMEYWHALHRSSTKEEYWVHFYHAHTQKIRAFAMQHLSMTYVEVELEDERMAETLEEYTKVSRSCVLHCHPGPKWVVQNNATHRCHPVGEDPTDKTARAEVAGPEDGDEEEDSTEEDDSVSDGDEAEGVDEDNVDNGDGEGVGEEEEEGEAGREGDDEVSNVDEAEDLAEEEEGGIAEVDDSAETEEGASGDSEEDGRARQEEEGEG